MGKGVNKIFIAFLVFIFVVPSMVYAQASVSEQRILGTWTDEDNSTWIFRSNGTFLYQEEGEYDSENGKFGISGTKIFMIIDRDEMVMEMFFSPDGRTLILAEVDGDYVGDYYILSKKN